MGAYGQPRLTKPILGIFVGEETSVIPVLSQYCENGDQRLSPSAPNICSVCFCTCSCICVNMVRD